LFLFDLPQPTDIKPTINNVCIGNEESILEKLIEVAAIKEQGRLEIEEHKALNAEAERTRREILSLRTVSLQTTQPTICTHQNRATEKSQGRPVGQGREWEHYKTWRTRGIDSENNREGVEQMRLVAIAVDVALYEERYGGSLATRNTKANRESFAFRNGDVRRIRNCIMERREQEYESFELKWAADEYTWQLSRERRESLAGGTRCSRPAYSWSRVSDENGGSSSPT
jgi:hypothetical protein